MGHNTCSGATGMARKDSRTRGAAPAIPSLRDDFARGRQEARLSELGDLARQLFRRAAKMHPLQSCDLNFKFFDQQIAAEKCAFRRHPRGAFGVELRALRSHEAAQGFNVIGKRGSVV